MLAATLAGCGNLLKSEKPVKRVFMLRPLAGDSGAGADMTGRIDLETDARVVPGLDTDRILALGNDASLMPIGNARWPDNMPEVFSSVIRRSLANTGRYTPTSPRRSRLDDNASLLVEVQSFYGIRSAGAVIRAEISLQADIDCHDRRKVLHISDSESVEDSSLSAIVAAHQRALDGATRELIAALDDHCGET
jgi:ABC-type uncharacterized transport system auxiliary subunit